MEIYALDEKACRSSEKNPRRAQVDRCGYIKPLQQAVNPPTAWLPVRNLTRENCKRARISLSGSTNARTSFLCFFTPLGVAA